MEESSEGVTWPEPEERDRELGKFDETESLERGEDIIGEGGKVQDSSGGGGRRIAAFRAHLA